jgi:hypothetical protein
MGLYFYRRKLRTLMLGAQAMLLLLLAPAAASPAASSAEAQEPSGNAIQQRGSTAWSRCRLAVTQLGPCVSSAPGGSPLSNEACLLGAQPLPLVLEPAASKKATISPPLTV